MLLGLVSHYFFGISIFLTSLFLILLVLVQRGRGGGIAGALGGAGGQSAFGTKAGDFFTRLTVGVAAFWIVLCIGAIKVLKSPTFTTGLSKSNSSIQDNSGNSASSTSTAPAGSAAEGTGNVPQAEVGGSIDLKNLEQFNPAPAANPTTPTNEASAPTTTPPPVENPPANPTTENPTPANPAGDAPVAPAAATDGGVPAVEVPNPGSTSSENGSPGQPQ
jgi:preprotein translocase subunit SecG